MGTPIRNRQMFFRDVEDGCLKNLKVKGELVGEETRNDPSRRRKPMTCMPSLARGMIFNDTLSDLKYST